MCEYIKARFPHIYLYTSTNGLAFTEEQARRLVRSGIDEVTFSIDGATPESYVKYRQRGDFDKAIRNLRAAADEKRRSRPRRAVHQLALHPVHPQRQRRGDGAGARDWRPRSASIACAGSSPITPRTCSRGASCPARRSCAAIKHEIWDDNNLGNAIPGATPRAQDRRPRPHCRACRSSARAGRPVDAATPRVQNLSTRPFPAQASYGRRLVRLGAQLCDRDGTVINRDFERAWLPRHAAARHRRVEIPITITAPADAGALRAEVRSGQRRDRLVRGLRIARRRRRRWW